MFEAQINHVKQRCKNIIPMDKWVIIDNEAILLSPPFDGLKAACAANEKICVNGVELENNFEAYSVINADEPGFFQICVRLSQITPLSLKISERPCLFKVVEKKFDVEKEVEKLRNTMIVWIENREPEEEDANIRFVLNKGLDRLSPTSYDRMKHVHESLPVLRNAKTIFEKILDKKLLTDEEIGVLTTLKDMEKGTTLAEAINTLLPLLQSKRCQVTSLNK